MHQLCIEWFGLPRKVSYICLGWVVAQLYFVVVISVDFVVITVASTLACQCRRFSKGFTASSIAASTATVVAWRTSR